MNNYAFLSSSRRIREYELLLAMRLSQILLEDFPFIWDDGKLPEMSEMHEVNAL